MANKIKKILENFKTLNETRFNEGDLVCYLSSNGPQYHCLARFIRLIEDDSVDMAEIEPLVTLNGDDAKEMFGDKTLTVKYSRLDIQDAETTLDKWLKRAEKRYNNLKELVE